MLPKLLLEASWAALGAPWGPRGSTLFRFVGFCLIFDRPGGGPGALWGALGVALGTLGASFSTPGGAFSRLGAGRGDNRTGSLKKQAFGIDVWLIFGTVFRCFSYSVRCVAGAVFSVLGGGFLRRFSSCSASLFVTRGKGHHAFDTVKPNEFS